jgi:outer membrane lipoprotein SlyB
MSRSLQAIAVAAFALFLAACAAPGGGPGEMEIRQGRIEQITMTTMKSNHDAGLGAVLGGVAGAGLGSLIGAGTGKDVAIAAGAIIGAVGGNYAQQTYFDKPQEAQQIYVRLSSGVLVSITQPVNPNLQTGMPVYIEGSGQEARVVPR